MNKEILNQRVRKFIVFNPLILLGVLIGCGQQKPDYLSKVPGIELFDYVKIDDWKELSTETLELQPIYKSGEDSLANLARIGFVEEVNDTSIWVADPLKAQVIEFDNSHKNGFKRKVLKTGQGPNEVVRPSSIYYDQKGDSLIYIIDSGQSCILTVTYEGIEKERKCLQNIPTQSVSVYFQVLGNNTYVWNSVMHEEYVVAEWDSSGSLTKGLVKRLIPLGYQPITYNNVVFDINKTDSSFVYSYKGLPLIFIKKNDKKFVINLLPDQRLNEFNVPLDTKSEAANIPVKNIIRDIYLVDDKIFVSLLTELFVIDIKRKRLTKKYIFTREDGSEIKFHMFKATNNKVYVIDQYHNEMYSVSTNSLIE